MQRSEVEDQKDEAVFAAIVREGEFFESVFARRRLCQLLSAILLLPLCYPVQLTHNPVTPSR